MYPIVHTQWCTGYLDEALSFVGSPTGLRLSVLTELALGQVVDRVDTHCLETIRTELQDSSTRHVALTAGQHSLNIGHHWLQVLTLVQEHTIPVGHLVFPVLLPLRQRRFLQQTVCLDNQFRSSSLESYTALDTDNGVAHIGITSDGIAGTNLLNLLDSLYTISEFLTVYTHYLTFLELNLQKRLLLGVCDVLQISLLGQTLCGVEQFATTDTGSPDTYVIRILQFSEVGKESVFVQEINLLFTCQFLVACQCDNLHTRSHHEECHIKTDLVVAGTCRSVSNGICTNLLGIACYGNSLEDTL